MPAQRSANVLLGAMYRWEEVCTEPGRRVKRPVIRVPGRILTRIDPQKMDTTMVMHIRPGWEDLRDFIRGTPDGNGGCALSTTHLITFGAML